MEADQRLLLVLASCDCPAQRQITGEKGPGARLGCEKCHQCAWRDPKYDEARRGPDGNAPIDEDDEEEVEEDVIEEEEEVDGEDLEGQVEEGINEDEDRDEGIDGAPDAMLPRPAPKTYSYPYPDNNPPHPPTFLARQVYDNAIAALQRAEASEESKAECKRIAADGGINFVSCLARVLPYFDVKRGFAMDALHDLQLGPIKNALEQTFGRSKFADRHAYNKKLSLRLPAAVGALVSTRYTALQCHIPSEKALRLRDPHRFHQYWKGMCVLPGVMGLMACIGSECAAIAKMMPYCLEITEAEVAAAVTKPTKKETAAARQRVADIVADVKKKLAKLNDLWELLANVTVLAELPALNADDLARLEKLTIDYNIFWRDTFGALGLFFNFLSHSL